MAEGFDADRAVLLEAVKRCAAIADEKGRPVRLGPQEGAVFLLSRALADQSEIADEIDARTTTKMPVGMNSVFLANALDALSGKDVQVRYITDPGDPTLLQVIMPMRG